jgi:hypothetical protein
MMQSSINFIGIGSQKSGTSWLFKQFEQSNQIDLPPIKELHYFDRSESYPSPNFLSQTKLTSRLFNLKWLAKALLKIKDEEENKLWYKKWFFSDYTDDWYLSLFKDIKKCKGEITPAYAILKEEDVAKMSKLLGRDTKIIFMLRHPVERAWSSYKYTNKIKEYTSDDFEHAKAYMQSEYQVLRSQYLQTIKLYNRYFNSICIGFFDAVIDKPTELLTEIFDYLELDTNEIKKFVDLKKRVNSSKQISIPEEIQGLLDVMYTDEINQLSELYGEYFSKWKDPKQFDNQNGVDFKPSIIIQ